jgi:hypothetical protein
MFRFLAGMQALTPLALSDRSFSASGNEAEIQRLLDAMARDSEALAHARSLAPAGYSVSSKVLREHVQRSAGMFRAGHRGYARWMVNATLEGCIGCHAQLPPTRSAAVRIAPQELAGEAIDRADLLFATRQFDAALALYDGIIRAAPAAGAGPGDAVSGRTPAERALLRKLAIWLRIKRDPSGAAASLEQDLAAKALARPEQEQVQAWIASLKAPELRPGFDPATVRFDALRTYARAVLAAELGAASVMEAPARAAGYLVLSGVLYEFLARNPAASEAGEALLWLSKCDRTLGGDFFFSLGDLYLEECVRRAPRTPIARRCAAEFEEAVEFRFTGSRGTDVPAELRQLIRRLKRQAG